MSTVPNHPTPPKRRMSRGKKVALVLLALVVALAVAVGVLLAVAPWAPKLEVTDPGPTGRRVTDAGLLANYYPAPTGARAPTVVVLGGSEGGLGRQVDRTARTLQAQGYTALALSYWGGPGQPAAMENLPLETFTGAFAWLRGQPEVDADRLGLIGTSKGGEAAVLLASRMPELKAVVGYVPSSVVWAGVNMRQPWAQLTIGSTWSAGGQPLPYLPYDGRDFRGGPVVQLYAASLKAIDQHPDAVIPIEKSNAPLLLVCGGQDQLWPSCDMSRAVEQRAKSHGGPEVTVLAYPDAGHFLSGPPADPGQHIDYTGMGGTQAGGEQAMADSWPKVLAFLKANLG